MTTSDTGLDAPHTGQLWLQLSGLSGGIGAIVDYGSLLLFVAVGVWPEWARGLSFACGSTTAYLLNRRWTFESRRNTREVLLVAAIYGSTFLIVLGVNAVALCLLPSPWWPITVAWVLSQGVGTTFNFGAQRWLVFARR